MAMQTFDVEKYKTELAQMKEEQSKWTELQRVLNNGKDIEYRLRFTRGDEYEILTDIVYTFNRNKMHYLHRKCGTTFLMTANNMQRGQNCPACAAKDRVDKLNKYVDEAKCGIEEIHKEFEEKYPNKEYVLVEGQVYTNNKVNLDVKCGKCEHIFGLSVVNFRQGRGCPNCHRRLKSTGTNGATEYINSIKALNIKGLSFIEEVQIYECRNKRPLPFDFGLCVKDELIGLIEFDGELHFKQTALRDGNLQDVQFRDNIKTTYCKENNIPLLRIKYDLTNTEMKNNTIAFIKDIVKNSDKLTQIKLTDLFKYIS